MMSPLAIPPLPAIGRWAVRKVHGNRRSSGGYLLTKKHFLDDDQEWRLGQAYLGSLGLPLFVLLFLVVRIGFGHLGHRYGGNVVFGHWSDLIWPLKILFPLAFLSHIIGFASVIRMVLVWGQIGTRDEIGE